MRIWAGDASYTDNTPQHNAWTPDQPFLSGIPGSAGYTTEGDQYYTASPVNGTADSALYQSSRDAQTLDYKFDVPPGNYQVTVKMAETYWQNPGKGSLPSWPRARR